MSRSEAHFRSMNLADIPTILEIEQAVFPDPWSEHVFVEELEQNRFAHYFVLEQVGMFIGYCGLWRVYDEAQITKIAVAARHQRQGWGEMLMSGCMALAENLGAKQMTLEVRASNYGAQRLYEKMGFSSAGVRPRFYTIEPEDAVIMWVMLNGKAEDIYIRN